MLFPIQYKPYVNLFLCSNVFLPALIRVITGNKEGNVFLHIIIFIKRKYFCENLREVKEIVRIKGFVR